MFRYSYRPSGMKRAVRTVDHGQICRNSFKRSMKDHTITSADYNFVMTLIAFVFKTREAPMKEEIRTKREARTACATPENETQFFWSDETQPKIELGADVLILER